ncbi:MAG: transposase, partial [Opitutaceae bacterium]|nr:transposase [Opitutaceae bacterium]
TRVCPRTEAAAGRGELARATLRTIRLKILKLAARVETTVRRIRARLAGASAAFAVFAHAHERLRRPGG